MADMTVSCRCGTLKGVLHGCSRKAGTRVLCYCKDCQAGAYALGASDMLDARGGTDLVQMIPSRLEITGGADQLACLRLSPNGLLRWYAACCDTPMFNTLGSRKLRFLGVISAVLAPAADEIFGPANVIANTKGAVAGEEPLRDQGVARAGFNIFKRHFGAKLTGQGATPLFQADGTPFAEPRVLTLEERNAATPD